MKHSFCYPLLPLLLCVLLSMVSCGGATVVRDTARVAPQNRITEESDIRRVMDKDILFRTSFTRAEYTILGDVTGTGVVVFTATVSNFPVTKTIPERVWVQQGLSNTNEVYMLDMVTENRSAFFYDEGDMMGDVMELAAARQALFNAVHDKPELDYIILPRYEVRREESRTGMEHFNRYGCTEYRLKITVTLRAKGIRLKTDAELDKELLRIYYGNNGGVK